MILSLLVLVRESPCSPCLDTLENAVVSGDIPINPPNPDIA